MRNFIEKDNGWWCGEKRIVEPATGKVFNMIQPNRIFDEDSYAITRAVAVEEITLTEPDFFVYQISYMPDGYSLCIRTVDEDTVLKLVSANMQAFMQGKARECIVKFFEDLKEK